MKNKKFKKIAIIISIVFLLLTFIIFPFIGKKLLTKEKYTPLLSINVSHDLKAEILFNNTMGKTPFTERLLSEIAQATNSIDIAMYSIDSSEIKDALFKASNHGVKVRFLSDSKKREAHTELFEGHSENFFFKDVPTNIDTSIIQPYMHNKFAIIDAGLSNEKLLTGAWNWTVAQELIDPTYLLITQEKEIIDSYKAEFDRLFSGEHSKFKFKNKDYKPFSKKITFTDSELEIWFSPGIETNSIQSRMYDLVDSAQKTINIMVWQMTDIKLANKLIQAEKRGVYINLITDDFNISLGDATFDYIKRQIKEQHLVNFNLFTDAARKVNIDGMENLNSYLHHHMMLVDNKTVMFGTNNWGGRGAFDNDENIMITNNKAIVESFANTFDMQNEELKAGYIGIATF